MVIPSNHKWNFKQLVSKLKLWYFTQAYLKPKWSFFTRYPPNRSDGFTWAKHKPKWACTQANHELSWDFTPGWSRTRVRFYTSWTHKPNWSFYMVELKVKGRLKTKSLNKFFNGFSFEPKQTLPWYKLFNQEKNTSPWIYNITFFKNKNLT